MPMTKDTLSYKLTKILKSTLAALALPIFMIYIMVAKPDYTIMNGLAHIILPVAKGLGDIVTWPIHVVGDGIDWIRETSSIRGENERLRKLLDDALANKYACDIAIDENKKLEHEISIKKASPFKTIIADIKFDDSVFHHNTFLINRGENDEIEKGMAVVSFDNRLVGIVNDCGFNFCRVRALSDSDMNIAIRIVGTDISGFLHGNGKNNASIEFFSDPKFTGKSGLKLITSNISGVLPSGIYVGDTINEKEVKILKPNSISRVMVLKFNNQDSYK